MLKRRFAFTGAVVVLCLGLLCALLACRATPALAAAPPAISVDGNQLEAGGAPIQLRGVNRAAYVSCSGNAVYDATFAPPGASPFGDPDDDFADGPVNQWSVDVMESWGVNAVRLPVNESCWLGDAGDPTRCETYAPEACETAADYRQDVENYVNLLGQSGLYVVLDLQDTAPPGYAATGIDYYPDRDSDNTSDFWGSATAAFAPDSWVLFDLSGEIGANPYSGPCNGACEYNQEGLTTNNWTDSQIWDCWLNGCDEVQSSYGSPADPVTYDTEGIQPLIDQIRAADSTTPIIIGTPNFDHGLNEADCSAPPSTAQGTDSCWSDYTPVDASGQMILDAHLYDRSFVNVDQGPDGLADPTPDEETAAITGADNYIENDLVPLSKQYPVMIGEMGETDCQDPNAPFVPGMLAELSQQIPTASVLGWTFDADTDGGNQVTSGWHCPTGTDGSGGPPLITDFDGAPTAMGQVLQTWLQAADPGHPATPPVPVYTAPVTATTPATSTTTPAPTTPAPPGPKTTGGRTVPPPKLGVKTAPHIMAKAGELLCTGAAFANVTDPTVTYTWFNAETHQRIVGPARSDAIAATKLDERPVTCEETVTAGTASVSASSRLLPVPGRVSAKPAGPVTLVAICPAGAGRSCDLTLSLAGSGKRPPALGSARFVIKAGKRSTASVKLSTAGRKLLKREHTLAATLTVTETVAGVKQTVAVAALKLR